VFTSIATRVTSFAVPSAALVQTGRGGGSNQPAPSLPERVDPERGPPKIPDGVVLKPQGVSFPSGLFIDLLPT
jgi:hypothetical protein